MLIFGKSSPPVRGSSLHPATLMSGVSFSQPQKGSLDLSICPLEVGAMGQKEQRQSTLDWHLLSPSLLFVT